MVNYCVVCKQHFGVLILKFLLNQISTHNMASLENIITRLRIMVLCSSYSAYQQSDTLKLLPWNCHWSPVWRKRWQIIKILSHASKSPFLFFCSVLIVLATLWSCCVKFSLNRFTAQKMTNFQNTVRRLIIIVLSLSYDAYHQYVNLEPLLSKFPGISLRPKRWPICKVLSHASQSTFSPSLLVPLTKPTFWNSYFKILVEAHYEENDDWFPKYCQTPRNHRFQEVFCCWS